jgi:hypothetical protein
MSKRARRVPARQPVRRPSPKERALEAALQAQVDVPVPNKKGLKKAAKLAAKVGGGVLGKVPDDPDANAAFPGMVAAIRYHRLPDLEDEERLGGAKIRNPLAETPVIKTDPSLLTSQ